MKDAARQLPMGLVRATVECTVSTRPSAIVVGGSFGFGKGGLTSAMFL